MEILQEARNLHMDHADDMHFLYGANGLRDAINFFRATRDMLAGGNSAGYSISVKWDGAPAVFVGTNPENGKFFVGTKSIFNKVPKINYNDADIDANHPGTLGEKLKVSLRYFKRLNIPKGVVLQGDLMYTTEDLEYDTIDGRKHIVFQPNTISYAVEENSPLGKRIKASKIGIVFHTTYKGSSMSDLSASFGADTSKLTQSKDVWFDNADIKNFSGKATMTDKETEVVTAILSGIGKKFRKLPSKFLNSIDATQKGNKLGPIMLIHGNSLIRNGKIVTDAKKAVDSLIKFVNERMEKEVAKVKTEKTKEKRRAEFGEVISEIEGNRKLLELAYDVQVDLLAVKGILIKKLESIEGETKTFVRDDSGYKVVAPEGFVAVSAAKGNAVKLVDRLSFSANNFNTDLKKWVKK